MKPRHNSLLEEYRKVKSLIESYQDIMERKQILYSQLLTISGENPLQEESLYVRLEDIERKETLILDMVFESSCLSMKEQLVLDRRSTGDTLEEIGAFFSQTRENMRHILKTSYKKLSVEFEEELKKVNDYESI